MFFFTFFPVSLPIFSAFEVQANHVQMTYYYLFIILFMVIAFLVALGSALFCVVSQYGFGFDLCALAKAHVLFLVLHYCYDSHHVLRLVVGLVAIVAVVEDKKKDMRFRKRTG